MTTAAGTAMNRTHSSSNRGPDIWFSLIGAVLRTMQELPRYFIACACSQETDGFMSANAPRGLSAAAAGAVASSGNRAGMRTHETALTFLLLQSKKGRPREEAVPESRWRPHHAGPPARHAACEPCG